MPSPSLNRTYVGFSSVVGDTVSVLYDVALINQDLLNAFNTKKGTVMTDPSYGSIAWDMLFETMGDATINTIYQDSLAIFASEPRVKLLNLTITPSTDITLPGYTLSATLQYIGLNTSGMFVTNFFNSLSDTGV